MAQHAAAKREGSQPREHWSDDPLRAQKLTLLEQSLTHTMRQRRREDRSDSWIVQEDKERRQKKAPQVVERLHQATKWLPRYFAPGQDLEQAYSALGDLFVMMSNEKIRFLKQLLVTSRQFKGQKYLGPEVLKEMVDWLDLGIDPETAINPAAPWLTLSGQRLRGFVGIIMQAKVRASHASMAYAAYLEVERTQRVVTLDGFENHFNAVAKHSNKDKRPVLGMIGMKDYDLAMVGDGDGSLSLHADRNGFRLFFRLDDPHLLAKLRAVEGKKNWVLTYEGTDFVTTASLHVKNGHLLIEELQPILRPHPAFRTDPELFNFIERLPEMALHLIEKKWSEIILAMRWMKKEQIYKILIPSTGGLIDNWNKSSASPGLRYYTELPQSQGYHLQMNDPFEIHPSASILFYWYKLMQLPSWRQKVRLRIANALVWILRARWLRDVWHRLRVGASVTARLHFRVRPSPILFRGA